MYKYLNNKKNYSLILSKSKPLFGENMENKNLIAAVSLILVMIAQAAGLYGFISSKIDANAESFNDIDKRMIKIEYMIESIEENTEETSEKVDMNSDRIYDLEISSSQNFRKIIKVEQEIQGND